jgi:hypothetical protein
MTGMLDVSSAETVKMPGSQERIARRLDPLPVVLESYWRPNHPMYRYLRQQAIIRKRRATAGIIGGLLAFAGLITLTVGKSAENTPALAIGIICCSVGIMVAVVAALWPNNPAPVPHHRHER